MNPIYRLLLLVCLAFLSPQIIRAEANIDQLEHEMLRLFYSEDSLKFRQAVSELKKASLAAGNEQKFYQAWGNEAIYECTHHRRTHGLQAEYIAQLNMERLEKENMVVDSGIGIEENMRKNIFAPLIHDRHSVSTTKMGLAICSNIVNLLGGKIWLDETYKKGCRFIFEIPKA